MKILYVTGHLRDADFVEHELHRLLPECRLDVSPTIEDALQRLSAPDACDAVLVDAVLPDGEAPRLVAHVRQVALPVPVIVLLGANDPNPPLQALEAGADDYLVKRQQHLGRLPAMLRGALERYRPPDEEKRRVLEVLYVGDAAAAPDQLKDPSRMRLDPARLRADGSLEQLEGAAIEQIPYDVIIVDDTLVGAHPLRALKDALVRAPEVPVILLAAPGNENLAFQALKMGADDCLVKTEGFADRLLLAVHKAISQRGVLREKAALHTTEGRLRLVLETVPACITVLACDGTFQAMNWSGLSIMGAGRIDQIVGKNIRDFVAPGQERPLLEFLEKICAGERGAIQFECRGLDKTVRRLELRAVPLKREADARVTVLGAILDVTESARLAGQTAGAAPVPPAGEPTVEKAEEHRRRSTDVPPGDDAAAQERFVIQKRLEAFERALRAAGARYTQLAQEYRQDRERWEGIRYELELQKGIAEEKVVILEQEVAALKARESEGEAERTALKERLQTLEAELAGAWETAEARRALLEQARWQVERGALNLEEVLAQERTKLELAEKTLQAAESARVELVEENRRLRSRLEEIGSELEKEAAARSALQEALRSAETGQADLIEDLERERGRAEEAREEFAKLRASLEQALAAAEERLAREKQERDAELARLEQARLEAERHSSELEHALAAAEERLAREKQERGAELARLEQARLEAERRSSELEQSLRAAEERLVQGIEGSRAEIERLKQEAGRLEQERAAFEEALRAAGARLRQEAEEHEAALASREQALEQAEQQRLALAEALKAAKARLAEEMELRRAEQALLERMRSELESRQAAVEEVQKAAEIRLAKQAEEHQAERARLESARAEAEAQRAALAAALDEAQARLARSLAQLDEQRDGFAQAVRGLEEENDRLQVALRAAEARLAAGAAEREAERAALEQARRELEQRNAALEEALAAADMRAAQLSEERRAEAEGFERSRQEWGQERAALEEALHSAEERLAAQVAAYQAETARLRAAQEESERRRFELEQALGASEAGCARLAEESRAEKARLEEALRQAEQACAGLEEQLRAAEAGLAGALEEQRAEFERAQATWQEERSRLEESVRIAGMPEREELGRLTARLQELERAHGELVELHRATEERAGALQAELQSAREREAQTEARHRAELEKLEALVARLQQELKESEERRAQLEEAWRAAEAERSQAEQYRAEVERLERALRDAEELKQAASESLQALQAQFAAASAEWRSRSERAEVLERELEQQRAARNALESALRTAEMHRAQLLEEAQGMRAQMERLQQELEQQRHARLALEDACRAAEAARAQLSERQLLEHGQLEEARRERDEYRAERERLLRLLAETSARYQSLLKQRTEHFQQLLRETVARCQQDAESQLQLLTAQHLEERETLEQLLREVEARQRQLDEQALAERRRLEARLAEVQAQHRRLLEYGFVAVAVTSLEGRLMSCNDAFARLFGYPNSSAALAHPEEWQTRFVSDHQTLETRLRAEGRLTGAESCVRAPDGRLSWVVENALVAPLPGDQAPVVERVFLDVTERHHLKEELRRSRRSESVGKLATAAVQTFNDLLTSMSGYSQLLIEGLSEGDPRRKNAERVRKVAGQASSLARQLLAYARRQERPPDLLDLNAALTRMEDLLRTLAGEDIEFAMTLGPDPGMISADRAEIEQVITAFVVHARDALPLGGAITVETSQTLVDMSEAGRPPEPHVLLAVKASGYGALPISCPPSIDAIITRCGGHLRTSCEPDKAAVIRLYLPRVEPAERAPEAAARGGAELEEE